MLNMNIVGIAIVGIILLVFFLAIFALIKIKVKYALLVEDLAVEEHRQKRVFGYAINNDMANDFKKAIDHRINEVNTPAIVDKHLNAYLKKTHTAERFVARAPGLMIVLGIVGTFFGLTLSIAELVDLLGSSSAALVGDVTMITSGLMESINGMAVAFVTSLFGIAASILFTTTSIFVGATEEKAHYVAMAEEYLDNVLGHRSSDLTLIDEHGRTPLEIAFEDLGERLSGELQAVSESISYKLSMASSSMKDTAQVIEKSLTAFDASVEKFSQNTRDFSEFNHHLKNNIQRMSLAFDDFATHLKDEGKEQ